ncbi:MAG TPA: 6-bladed beta-propeller, partial [Deltaproteobacteria bacterium]|nr:6-bladed beta-propeller [Deltaproteobacteria bacterium]
LCAALPAWGFELRPAELLFYVTAPASEPLSLPTDLVVDSRSNIYVLDGVNNRVAVFDGRGRYLRSFGEKGESGGAFDTPVGIGIDTSDRIYVCDTKNARVVVFDPSGKFLSETALKVPEGLAAPRPVDIVVDDYRGLLYISDNANHAVLVYSRDGRYLRRWGERGGGEDQFRYPATAARDGYRLYVADVLGTRVQVINIDKSEFAGQIGRWGVLPGELFRPKGVAVDSEGRVYVADSYMDVIQVFDEYGGLLHILGDGEGRIRRFTSPAGLFIDGSDRLYVVEMLDNRVGVYGLK